MFAKIRHIRIPDWVWEFHGHRCPFVPIGYKMGRLAMERLGIKKVKDHGVFVLSEMGIGHPQTCMIDGLQAVTGCTYGKLLIERLNLGKIAAIIYLPKKTALRISVKPDFLDELGEYEFFNYRKRGIEPSKIPKKVVDLAIEKVLKTQVDNMFKIEEVVGFSFERPKSSFSKRKCSLCGEYVFERYLQMKDGKYICKSCIG